MFSCNSYIGPNIGYELKYLFRIEMVTNKIIMERIFLDTVVRYNNNYADFVLAHFR